MRAPLQLIFGRPEDRGQKYMNMVPEAAEPGRTRLTLLNPEVQWVGGAWKHSSAGTPNEYDN